MKLSGVPNHNRPSRDELQSLSAPYPRDWQQGLLDFVSEPKKTTELPDHQSLHSEGIPPEIENACPKVSPQASEELRAVCFSGRIHGISPRSKAAHLKGFRGQPSLFDFLSQNTSPSEHLPDAEPGASLLAESTAEARSEIGKHSYFRSSPSQEFEPSAPVSIASGEKAKGQDALAAVRVLMIIEEENRPATFEERRTLGRFAGFGPIALSVFPDPVTGLYKDASWQALGESLKALLTAEEYASAKRTTFNAFYTSPTVIRAMHLALIRLGVPSTGTVLEPGCGIGNFMSLAPTGMRFIGVEMDGISGRIAKALHPEQDIRIENFRDSRLADDSLDAVIGNVPFADLKLAHRGQRFSLHDYFFAKSIDAVRPGGILALVTSHFTLDKQNAAIREYLAAKADFVGAIRLPSDAFKREGTAVVTDIVFLRKRASGEAAAHVDPEWLGIAPVVIEGLDVSINRYFHNHPEMVLGIWTRKDTLYGEGYSVTGRGDLAGQLAAAIQRLPEYEALTPPLVQERPAEAFARPPPERGLSEGSFFIADDRTICQIMDGQEISVVYGGTNLRADGTMTGKRFAALIRLRDLARLVLESQNEGWPEKERIDARRELNWAHDRFEGIYGPINKTTFGETVDGHLIRRMPNLVKFREDPDAMLVMSLESYDEASGRATKAAILQKDVVGKTPPILSVKSAEEGLLVSLNQWGTVDLAFIANLYGKPEEEIITELGNLIFHDPSSKTWQTADTLRVRPHVRRGSCGRIRGRALS